MASHAPLEHQDSIMRTDNKRKGGKTRNFIEAKLQKHNRKIQPLTADQFLEIWKHYDRDASRFLEENEVREFLRDFMNSSLVGLDAPKNITEAEAKELTAIFMDEFDENKDNKISIRELSAVLPVEESFFVIFRTAVTGENGIDYMKVWKKYDTDGSGYIEVDELKSFLRDLIAKSKVGKQIDDKKLAEFAQTIMMLFDSNNDGKLSLQELLHLLPAQENFVQLALDKAHSLQRLNQSDIDKLLDRYDRNKSGTLEGTELQNLVRDILEDQAKLTGTPYDASHVFEVEKALLKGCDMDGNGKIDRKELAVILLAISRAGLSGIYNQADNFAQEVHGSNGQKQGPGQGARRN